MFVEGPRWRSTVRTTVAGSCSGGAVPSWTRHCRRGDRRRIRTSLGPPAVTTGTGPQVLLLPGRTSARRHLAASDLGWQPRSGDGGRPPRSAGPERRHPRPGRRGLQPPRWLGEVPRQQIGHAPVLLVRGVPRGGAVALCAGDRRIGELALVIARRSRRRPAGCRDPRGLGAVAVAAHPARADRVLSTMDGGAGSWTGANSLRWLAMVPRHARSRPGARTAPPSTC
ncbi:hypothetical protein HBB16_10460 [Pseudonocardia sp. MCCB 268]|nr:hypothetical protein [Pseudonocardia cytotoxica]